MYNQGGCFSCYFVRLVVSRHVVLTDLGSISGQSKIPNVIVFYHETNMALFSNIQRLIIMHAMHVPLLCQLNHHSFAQSTVERGLLFFLGSPLNYIGYWTVIIYIIIFILQKSIKSYFYPHTFIWATTLIHHLQTSKQFTCS